MAQFAALLTSIVANGSACATAVYNACVVDVVDKTTVLSKSRRYRMFASPSLAATPVLLASSDGQTEP